MSKEATRALAGPRTLSTLVPSYQGTSNGVVFEAKPGWQRYGTLVYHEAYFDMEGFTRDAMTTFPQGATIQDPGIYTNTKSDLRMDVIDIICTERIPPVQLGSWLVTDNALPGMLETSMDWGQIIWGQWRGMLGQATFQSNATTYLASNVVLFGSGAATTARKLWVYRFVVVNGHEDGDTLNIPSSRIILNTVQAQEGDKEFLMRQKRSYELGESY
jgi:hypothetical protein